MLAFLNKYFLLTDEQISSREVANWRISALRIILTSGLLVCLFVAGHTFSKAVQFNLFYVIALSFGFSFALIALLAISRKYYLYCAHGLLLAIVIACISMNLFLIDLQLAEVGSTFMYSCPIIALMLIGRRTAMVYAFQQVAIMAQMGCKEFQGFYFAKPMSASAYGQHVKTHGLRFIAPTEESAVDLETDKERG